MSFYGWVVILFFYIPDANPLSNMICKDFLLFYELWLHFFLWYCFFNSRNYCIIQVREYLLWFFSKKFIVIYLTYRSLILFKWIFLYDVKYKSKFIHMRVNALLFQYHLLKTLFSALNFLVSLYNLFEHEWIRIFLGSSMLLVLQV